MVNAFTGLLHVIDATFWLALFVACVHVALVWAPARKGVRASHWAAVLALLLAAVLLLKRLVGERRPDGTDARSFPSGHAAASAFVAASLLPAGPVLLPTWAGLVATSRVHFRRHYVRDVLAGIMLGWLAGWAVASGAVARVSMRPIRNIFH